MAINNLRNEMIDFRKKLNPSDKVVYDKRINFLICKYLDTVSSEHVDILFYHPLSDEVDVKEAIICALSKGFHVALPRVHGHEMDFFYIKDMECDLSEGNFHVMEPVASCPKINPDRKKIAIVPGLCFDKHGNRMGYGKGYYDRYFASHNVEYKIGVCYQGQVVPVLTANSWDVPMDLVITDACIFENASSLLKKINY